MSTRGEQAGSLSVGFAGLGVMGRPMASRLLAAGFPLTVWNRSERRCDELVAAGARRAFKPSELVGAAEVVVTMLSDDSAVLSVCTELIDQAPEGTTVVDMSSVSPSIARELHRLARGRGVDFVDAPVSGGEKGAVEGTLSIMVGGDSEPVERVRPVLEAMASKVVHVGGPGAGDATKAVNQAIVGLNLQAVAEGLTLASASGLDPQRVLEALAGGFADSVVLRQHGPRMVSGDFRPGGRIALHLKDLRIALELAAEQATELPATSALAALMAQRVEAGDGDLDQSAIVRAYKGTAAKL